MSRLWPRRVLSVLGSLMLICTACGGDDDSDQAATTTQSAATPSTTAAPQRGGVVVVGQYAREVGLDPAKNSAGGCCGANELAAIYDVLIRYNDETGRYEPGTAESLTPNADFAIWTMKIRPNIKFTDGTPYDAAAVKFVHDRQIKDGTGSPKSELVSTVKTVEVVDPLTVKYTLNEGWAGFPIVLASTNGFIYSRSAFERAGANFNSAPGDAGAGPFKIKAYRPGESLELERNPGYWGDDVYLDGVKFVLIEGAAATFDAVQTGTLTAGAVRDPVVVEAAKAKNLSTLVMPQTAGNMINMNSAQKPTSDARVRRAIGHAIDVQVINTRAWEGKAPVSKAPFANSNWDPNVDGPKYDVAAAKTLVAQVKSEGWDGKIRVLAPNTPEGMAWSEAVASMLRLADMDARVENKPTSEMVNQVNVNKDFDLVFWGGGMGDEPDNNYLRLKAFFNPKSPRFGYVSQDMGSAVELLRTADTDAKKTAAYKAISEIWTKDVPMLVVTSAPQALIYSPKLHGVRRSAISIILFDKAWIEK